MAKFKQGDRVKKKNSLVVQVCMHCWEKAASIEDRLCVECRKAHNEARRMEGYRI